MDYQVSARRFRPGTFDEVIGQPHVVQTLKNAVAQRRVAHAYVFSGMRGVGKTTVARILAKALNCEHGPTPNPCGHCESCREIAQGHSVDVIEIDGASNTGVDNVRELRENIKFTPFLGSYRIYIIDEVHMLSNSAFNALLKTLEEPPPHAIFVFATTEVHKIPATILSRCQHFTFRRIPRREIIARLRVVAARQDVTIDERSLAIIARVCDGSMRDALSLFDQAVTFGGKTICAEEVESMLGTVPDERVRQVVTAMLEQQPSAALFFLGQAIDHGYDLRVLCSAVVERLRNMVLARVVPSREQVQFLVDLSPEEVEQICADAQKQSLDHLQSIFELMSQVGDRLRVTDHPRFVFEVAVVRASRLVQETSSPTVSPQRESPESPPRESSSARPGALSPPSARPREADRSRPMTRTVSGRLESRQDMPRVPSQPPSQEVTASSGGGKAKEQAKQAPQSPPMWPSGGDGQPEISQQDWDRVVQKVLSDYPNIGSFLEMGRLVKLDGQEVVIGFPKTATVAYSRLQKEANRQVVARVFEQVVGRSTSVRVIEIAEGHMPGPTIGQARQQQRLTEERRLLEEARAHPLVKQAMEMFGGEVITASRLSGEKEDS
ncbi:MAG: DNA polymerase III subunit gamma/tau [Nitrospirae bacterium]|nr:MAG: DNA polymerase III subunit gamma/tau [Nitrospirota bacterium]